MRVSWKKKKILCVSTYEAIMFCCPLLQQKRAECATSHFIAVFFSHHSLTHFIVIFFFFPQLHLHFNDSWISRRMNSQCKFLICAFLHFFFLIYREELNDVNSSIKAYLSLSVVEVTFMSFQSFTLVLTRTFCLPLSTFV